MRIILTALAVVASISTASAQSTPDVKRTVDPAPSRAATDAPPAPNHSADFIINGGATIPAAPARTPEQRKADEAAQAAWQARCRPTVVEDRDGIRRTHYAKSDCDLSTFNTAGAR